MTGNPTMTDDTTRVLFCLVEGDSAGPFNVPVSVYRQIFYLKELVKEKGKNGVFRSVDAVDLVLWKLHEPELVEPDNTLVERMQSRGADFSQFAVRLGIQDDVLDIFPEQVSKKHVHIVVQLPPGTASEKDTDEKVNEFLEKHRESVNAFLRQTDLWPTWESSSEDQRVADHIANLKIPLVDGAPKLLLHELGGDVVEKSTVARLFDPWVENIQFINTPGSGKTRILLEGLCVEWGFYFTCAPSESLGSSDVAHSFGSLGTTADFTKELHSLPNRESPGLIRNRELARRQFLQVLTARLFVFHMFFEEARKVLPSGSLGRFRKHWLVFQLQSHRVVGVDIFRQLTKMLHMAIDNYLGVDYHGLSKAHTLVGDIRIKYLQTRRLYYVLDEAQNPERLFKAAFRSKVNRTERSLLSEILVAWKELGSIILSGTALLVKDVREPVGSRMAKPGVLKWSTLSQTGAFDSQQAQAAYILRYLPPHIAESPSGQLLLHRAWSWLRGRYSLTATFVDYLVKDSFRSPHKLLDQYIVGLLGVIPSDTPEFAQGEHDISDTDIVGPFALQHVGKWNRIWVA